ARGPKSGSVAGLHDPISGLLQRRTPRPGASAVERGIFSQALRACLLALTLATGIALAQDVGLPISIAADAVEVDQRANTSTYAGNVLLTQGELKLEASQLKVYLEDRRLGRIEASGTPARIRTATPEGQVVTGSARAIHYLSAKGELQLLGDGMLDQAGNTIRNDRIEFNLNTRRLRAGGEQSKQRVEVILQPPAQ
ncbi:MAG: lipopolysaccharide transport periplasmic protein LptA, partial [Thiotrichales bacterium]